MDNKPKLPLFYSFSLCIIQIVSRETSAKSPSPIVSCETLAEIPFHATFTPQGLVLPSNAFAQDGRRSLAKFAQAFRIVSCETLIFTPFQAIVSCETLIFERFCGFRGVLRGFDCFP